MMDTWEGWHPDDSVAAVRAKAEAHLAKRAAEVAPEPEPLPDPYAKLPIAPTVKDHTYLYIVEVGQMVKVGYAANLYVRFSNLRVDNPFEATLETFWEMPKKVALDVGRFVHIALAAKHVRGEWFDLSAKEARSHVERIRETVMHLYNQVA